MCRVMNNFLVLVCFLDYVFDIVLNKIIIERFQNRIDHLHFFKNYIII